METENAEVVETKEIVDTPVVEETTEQRQERIENLLITEGVMIPGKDLVHYMTRNASYMRLINSQEFKDSGIKLEEVLDDDFIREQFEGNAKTAEMMRFVTESIIPLMKELPKDTQLEEATEVVKELIND